MWSKRTILHKMAYAECTILHNSWLTRGAELAYVLMYQVFSKKTGAVWYSPCFL